MLTPSVLFAQPLASSPTALSLQRRAPSTRVAGLTGRVRGLLRLAVLGAVREAAVPALREADGGSEHCRQPRQRTSASPLSPLHRDRCHEHPHAQRMQRSSAGADVGVRAVQAHGSRKARGQGGGGGIASREVKQVEPAAEESLSTATAPAARTKARGLLASDEATTMSWARLLHSSRSCGVWQRMHSSTRNTHRCLFMAFLPK